MFEGDALATVDNQLNWRRVFPDAPTDVSGWDLANRMKLPDWCFGSKRVVSTYALAIGAPDTKWSISLTALPDPCCIWTMFVFWMPEPPAVGHVRIGLADVVPTSAAEMSAADEIFPDLGSFSAGPNYFPMHAQTYTLWQINVRKGMVTDGKYLVAEAYVVSGKVRVEAGLVVSELPTEVPAFLDPNLS